VRKNYLAPPLRYKRELTIKLNTFKALFFSYVRPGALGIFRICLLFYILEDTQNKK